MAPSKDDKKEDESTPLLHATRAKVKGRKSPKRKQFASSSDDDTPPPPPPNNDIPPPPPPDDKIPPPPPPPPLSRRGSFVQGGVSSGDADVLDLKEEKKDEPIVNKASDDKEEKKEEKKQEPIARRPSIPDVEVKIPDKEEAYPSFELLGIPDNALGKILHTGLNSENSAERAKTFKSLLNFAKSVDRETQIKFFKRIAIKLDVNKSNNVNLVKFMNQDLLQAEKKLKQGAGIIDRNGKSNEDNYKDLKDSLFAELEKVASNLPTTDYDNPSWESIITLLSKPVINSETKNLHVGNIFNAIVPPPVKANVSNIELRDIFEKQGITNGRWFSEKTSGANKPGEEGGQYRHVYQDADGILRFPIVFYKEPTDDDEKDPGGPGIINFQEGIAEVMGGRIMNKLFGDITAPIYATPLLGRDGTKHVYVASVYHNKFSDLHTVAYQYLGVTENIPFRKRKHKFELWGIYEKSKDAYKAIFLGDGNYEHKVKTVFTDPTTGKKTENVTAGFTADKAELRKSLGTAALSSIFVGNYQIHSENLGFGEVNGKMQVVSLDYGGTMRPDYKNPLPGVTGPQKHGRFERSVRPTAHEGKKYGTSYLVKHFHEDIRLSPEFIAGADVVANQSLQKIIETVNEEVAYGIEKYGAGVFYDNLAYGLDRRKDATFFKMPRFAGREPTEAEKRWIILETTEFLRDTFLARRLSSKEFSVELKLESAKHTLKGAELQTRMLELAKENPLFALQNPKKFKVGEKLDNKFVAKQYASDKGAPVLDAMVNEFNLVPLTKTKNEGIRRLAKLTEKRLDIALQSILDVDFPGKDELFKELTLTKLQLNYMLLSPDYKSEMDHNIIALMADEVFRGIKTICTNIPEAKLQEFIDKQLEMTPKNAPGDTKPWPITTAAAANKYFSEASQTNIYNLSGGVVAVPSPPPSPQASPSSVRRPSVSGNGAGSPAPRSPAPSVAGLSMFAHKVQKSFTDLLSDFVIKIANTFDKDKVARDALSQFVNSNIGEQELRNPNNVILNRVRDIARAGISRITLPKNVLRTNLMTQDQFNSTYSSVAQIASAQPIKISKLLSNEAPSLNDAPPPSQNFYAMNFMTSASASAAAPTPTTTKGLASFLEARVNNVYSIQAVTLPPEVSRSYLLETHLQGVSPLVIQTLREELRNIEIAAFKLGTESEHNTHLNNEITAMLKRTSVDAAQITAFLTAYRQNCQQIIGGNAAPAKGYLEFVKAQIQKFVSEGGSNKTVRIIPTNDPLLAQAYVLICKANGLKFNNQSGFEFKESTANQQVLDYVKANFKVETGLTLEAVKVLVNEIDKKLEKINAPLDPKNTDPSIKVLTEKLKEFKAEVTKFKTKADSGEHIPNRDLYNLIDNISAATTANEAKLLPPRQDAHRRGSH